MSELSKKTCTPCRGGVPALTAAQAAQLIEGTPGWSFAEEGRCIIRSFRFDDFTLAMEFACGVGDLAEGEGHHPDITFGWGYCRVSFHTHKIKGLHENDFIMAAKVNTLAAKLSS